MPAVEIICLLGRVRSPDPEIDVDCSEASRNSGKWIFDVTQDPRRTQSLRIQLLDNHGAVRDGAWFSPSIAPLNAPAAGARLHFAEPNAPTVEIRCDPGIEVLEYRVTIDAVHSGAR